MGYLLPKLQQRLEVEQLVYRKVQEWNKSECASLFESLILF